MSPFAIETRNLGKAFGDLWALRGAALRVPEGAFVAVLGRNGAGKTTLVKLLTGQLLPTEGEARVGGLDPAALEPGLREAAGVMPAEGSLLEDLAGAQYLHFAARLHGLVQREAERRIRELQDRLEVDFASPVPVRDYSFGMRKKLAFAAAVLHGPRILFLDEPFEGLDPSAAGTLLEILEGLRVQGATLFMTSHQLNRAERLATHVLLIDGGRVVLDGPATEVLGPEEDLEALFLRHVGRAKGRGALSWM